MTFALSQINNTLVYVIIILMQLLIGKNYLRFKWIKLNLLAAKTKQKTNYFVKRLNEINFFLVIFISYVLGEKKTHNNERSLHFVIHLSLFFILHISFATPLTTSSTTPFATLFISSAIIIINILMLKKQKTKHVNNLYNNLE